MDLCLALARFRASLLGRKCSADPGPIRDFLLTTISFEAVVTGTIADLFFVHQRGKYSAAWVMCQLGPTNLAPLVCAYIATNLGWRWAFCMFRSIIFSSSLSLIRYQGSWLFSVEFARFYYFSSVPRHITNAIRTLKQ